MIGFATSILIFSVLLLLWISNYVGPPRGIPVNIYVPTLVVLLATIAGSIGWLIDMAPNTPTEIVQQTNGWS